MDKEKIEQCVMKVLKEAKIPRSFLAFRYLKTILVENYNKEFNKSLYYECAKKYNTTALNVERAIRYICDSYQKQIQSYFNTNYKITNKKLFYLLKEKTEYEIECYS